jgi:1-acyl-sn-glycerol-3-phosphate acyltransferase
MTLQRGQRSCARQPGAYNRARPARVAQFHAEPSRTLDYAPATSMPDSNASSGERSPVTLEPDTALDGVVAAALWGAGLAWLAPMMGLQMVLHRTVGPDRMQWVERLYTRGQIALTGSRWRAVVDPAIDPATPYLFFQNHTNHLDHCAMYAATPHFKQGVELEEHFRYPIYGAFMRSRGTLPVRRNSPRDFLQLREQIRAELQRGHSLLIFPEGTRTLTGLLGPLQQGVFRIALEIGAPIVPVTVTGMYRVMRKGSLLIRPGHEVTVYCDAPVATAGMKRRDLPDLVEKVRSTMAARLDAYWAASAK